MSRVLLSPVPSLVPEGTYEITGQIVTLSYRQRRNSGPPGRYIRRYVPHPVMRVVDDRGFEVWGTVPRNIEQALIPLVYAHRHQYSNMYELISDGRDGGPTARVRFTATVERAADDPWVGLYKRPRKALLLDALDLAAAA